jgi:hypothetical protein
MFVQWCIKGVSGIDDSGARRIIDDRQGLQCRWWRNVHLIQPDQIAGKLTSANLDLHVNHYSATDPATGVPFCDGTPFISMAAGSVERSTFLQTNIAHPARMVALDFATAGGTIDGYLYICYVIVGLRPAVGVEGVAEEVRELNTYRRYSPFQTEGEITAKIHVPANQIQRCEAYSVARRGVVRAVPDWVHVNPLFEDPVSISNIRELF